MKRQILLIAAVLMAIAAIPTHRPKPWTFAYRQDWNEGCYLSLTSGEGPLSDKEQIAIRNGCDCMSDLLQERYTEQENDALDRNPTADFIRYVKSVAHTCFSDPT